MIKQWSSQWNCGINKKSHELTKKAMKDTESQSKTK